MTEFKVGDRVNPRWTVKHTGTITYLSTYLNGKGVAASVQWDGTGNINSWLLKNLIKIEEEPMFKVGDEIVDKYDTQKTARVVTLWRDPKLPGSDEKLIILVHNSAMYEIAHPVDWRLKMEPKYLFQVGDKVQDKTSLGLVGAVIATIHNNGHEYLAVRWVPDGRPVIEEPEALKLV